MRETNGAGGSPPSHVEAPGVKRAGPWGQAAINAMNRVNASHAKVTRAQRSMDQAGCSGRRAGTVRRGMSEQCIALRTQVTRRGAEHGRLVMLVNRSRGRAYTDAKRRLDYATRQLNAAKRKLRSTCQ